MLSFLYRAFYDRTLFSRYVEKGKGYGIKLLFILVLFSALSFSLRLFVLFSSVPERMIDDFVAQMPEFIIENGAVVSPKDFKYSYVSEDKKVFFIFDTTQKTINLKELPLTGIYVTDDAILTVRRGEMRRIPLVKIVSKPNFVLDQNGMRHAINRAVHLSKIFVPPLMFVFGFPGIFIATFFMVTVSFVFSFMMTRIVAVPLNKEQRSRLAVLSVVPISVINALSIIFNAGFHGEGLTLSVILIYMFCFLKDGQKELNQAGS